MWQNTFQNDIQEKIFQAKDEFHRFNQSQQLIYLQQAGNKLFSAIENFFMIKYNVRVQSYSQLRKIVLKHKKDYHLLRDAVQLHYFFYNADLTMDRIDAIHLFTDVLQRFEKMIQL